MKSHTCIEALRDGFQDAGVAVITNYPGFFSHILFSAMGGRITSVNEKVAFEIGWGASLAGKRTVVTFKNVGLNDAADPFLNSMLSGINAGLTVVVFDDVEVVGSQSRQDSRHYFDFYGGLWLEPYSIESAYRFAFQSMTFSEQFKIPVVLRITNQLLAKTGEYIREPSRAGAIGFVRDQSRFVVHPSNSQLQREHLDCKNALIRTFVEQLYPENSWGSVGCNGLVVFGCCDRELANYPKELWECFQVFSYPPPVKAISSFLEGKQQICILEQGSNYAYEKIRAANCHLRAVYGDSGTIPDHSGGYIKSNAYEKLFASLKKFRPAAIIGDLGEYTSDSLGTIDACLCLGSSLPVGVGVTTAGVEDTFVVVGDAAFLHSGKNVIPEALLRGTKINIVVICNGGARTTGGQKVPGDLNCLLPAGSSLELPYESSTEHDFMEAYRKMSENKSISILFVKMEEKG